LSTDAVIIVENALRRLAERQHRHGQHLDLMRAPVRDLRKLPAK
jgi:Cu/Ag efflux pump CusA